MNMTPIEKVFVKALLVTILITSFFMLAGCVSYQHVRTLPGGAVERTAYTALLQKSTANKISAITKDGTNYSRTIKVGSIDQDISEQVGNIVESAVAGAVKGATKP